MERLKYSVDILKNCDLDAAKEMDGGVLDAFINLCDKQLSAEDPSLKDEFNHTLYDIAQDFPRRTNLYVWKYQGDICGAILDLLDDWNEWNPNMDD